MKTDKVEGNKVRLMSQGIHTERKEKLVLFKGICLNHFAFILHLVTTARFMTLEIKNYKFIPYIKNADFC